MGERVALMVRPGRRMGPRPAGSIFLIAELSRGLTRRDLDAALAKGALEITDWPADPEAVVGSEPLPSREEVVQAEPVAPAIKEEPRVPPVASSRHGTASSGPVAPAAPAVAAPSTTEKAPPAPVTPAAPAVTEKPRPAPVTSSAPKTAPKPAISEDKEAKLLAKLLADKHSKTELIALAKKAGATYSDRGTKEEIALEIVEAEAAKKSRRGR